MIQGNEHIHFIGIGGAGMSPLAELMMTSGYTVTGSDLAHTSTTDRLTEMGIVIQFDHDPLLVKEADLVVYTSAVHTGNAELDYGIQHGIRTIKRAEMLGDVMKSRFTVGVSGTHGKTTTTSLAGTILRDAGLDPLVLVGGELREMGSNAIVGKGNILVAEADEYDRSFLKMYPSIAVITNIEEDHLDIYKDLADIKESFIAYAEKVPFYGAVVACTDDEGVMSIVTRINKKVITYGINNDAHYQAVDIEYGTHGTSFVVYRHGHVMGKLTIPLLGIHNVRNTLAACAVATELKVSFGVIAESVRKFRGVKRRFEIVGVVNDVIVVDDYAHHPTEIAATLSGARNLACKKVVAVFQPHLYSRTRDFYKTFAESLMSADHVILMNIYKARELPIPGVSSALIADVLVQMGHKNLIIAENASAAIDACVKVVDKGDAVIFMGAGDIGKLGATLVERLGHGA